MSQWLRQSAVVVIPFGPMLDKTDGVTLETAAGIITSLDHATTGIMLSKNGGTLAVREQGANFVASTYDAHGCFKVSLSAVDTATLGRLRVIHTEPATYLAVWQDLMVVTQQVWDSLFGADKLDVAVVEQANIDFGALQKTSLNAATPAVTVSDKTGFSGTVAAINNIDFPALMKTSLNAATPAVTVSDKTGFSGSMTVSDKTGFSLSTAGILAIWHQALADIATALSIGKKLKDWALGADNKALLSTDAQTGVTIPTVTNLTNTPGAGDFNATQKLSLNAATPASVQNIPANGSGFTALGDTRIANLDMKVSEIAAGSGITEEQAQEAAEAALATYTAPTKAEMDAAIAGIGSGSGNTTKVYTVLDGGGHALSGVTVTARAENDVTAPVIAKGVTGDVGTVTFLLDSGTTYYLWRRKAGYTFTNPDTEVIP
jgi:hypothetical protein